MAPVIQVLKASSWADVTVLATAQHRHMLDQVLDCFSIRADVDFNLMKRDQSLSNLTSQLLEKSTQLFNELQPDAVLVHGDTTTAMTCSLAAFYGRIPVGHVEAGLRTGCMHNPFPEEFNRVSIARMATWHFSPTHDARDNLQREGVELGNIVVTGNTVIDALLSVSRQVTHFSEMAGGKSKKILVTCHRRENFGEPLERICAALKRLALEHLTYEVIYPVHPNPNVRNAVYSALSNVPNITLCEPLAYADFVSMMKKCDFVITDSGGIQEEAPALGKPVLVLRNETERPEALKLGAIRLVGTEEDMIFNAANQLITDELTYKSMVIGYSPYGDGQASQRIATYLKAKL